MPDDFISIREKHKIYKREKMNLGKTFFPLTKLFSSKMNGFFLSFLKRNSFSFFNRQSLFMNGNEWKEKNEN